MGFLIFLGFVGTIIAIVAAHKAREELNKAWHVVGNEMGLTHTASDWSVAPRLEGTVSGSSVTVDIDKRGSGKSQTPYTRFRVGIPGMGSDLLIKEEGFLSAISRALGSGDIQVGDAEFDRRFHIQGHDAHAVREYLTPRRRVVLRRFFNTHDNSLIEKSALTWAAKGKIKNSGQMIATVEDMLTVAREFQPESQAAAPEPEVQTEPLTPIDPAPIEPEPELAAEADADFEAEAEVATESEFASEPEVESEAAEAVELAEVPEPPEAPEPAAAPEPESVAAAANSGVDLDDFCDSVFTPGALSYQATQTFDSRFKGEQASWTGTLQSVEPYSYDFVFGAGKGLRATVQVHQVDGGLTGDGIVRAVVQLPAEFTDLQDRIGDRLRFSGKLVKVDGLMRKVFVADGQSSL